MAQWSSASRLATACATNARALSYPNEIRKFSCLPVDAKEKNSMKSKQMSYRLGLVLVMSGLCATLSGCVNKAQQNFESPPAPVVVSTAVSQDVSNYMDALGKIVARETVAIQPQVSGRIEK